MDQFIKIILLEAVWKNALLTQEAADYIISDEYGRAAIALDRVIDDLGKVREELHAATRRQEDARRSTIAPL